VPHRNSRSTGPLRRAGVCRDSYQPLVRPANRVVDSHPRIRFDRYATSGDSRLLVLSASDPDSGRGFVSADAAVLSFQVVSLEMEPNSSDSAWFRRPPEHCRNTAAIQRRSAILRRPSGDKR